MTGLASDEKVLATELFVESEGPADRRPVLNKVFGLGKGQSASISMYDSNRT
jgi:hypothetical protein